ncbi:DUF2917 domain-containing protein [Aquirhabdus parva]|uniref:DUF2917 domain-containing protein n=1 Tax=Aquirhabdus parva TaxID=2283318 RepID=A0A345P810_9GAMM|nr:DUF2917 domain-containing protein [Aquirhabdus parva]AXI03419.1 DUF2917 domain-containing protein [Aquirhabdus parva]
MMQHALSQQPIRIENGQYQSIQCVDGTVWLTCANDDHDYFLTAGESFNLSRCEGVVLSGIEKNTVANLQDLAVIPEYAIV